MTTYQHIVVPAEGQKITVNADMSLNVPDEPIIPFIEGDGTGLDITPVDYAWAAVAGLWITSHMRAYDLADRIPVVRDLADARLVQKLHEQLARFGHAEYTTHGERYRPMQPAVAR